MFLMYKCTKLCKTNKRGLMYQKIPSNVIVFYTSYISSIKVFSSTSPFTI